MTACPVCGSARILTKLPTRKDHIPMPAVSECRDCHWTGTAKELSNLPTKDDQHRRSAVEEKVRA